ncbi:MAG: acyl-CoA thioesterase [Bacteroidia bacterium]|jgi:acyl-CoA thioesterase
MSDSKPLYTRVVDKMYNNDPFSQWLGIERVEDGAGVSIVRLTVRKEMLNGFDVAHGGITYSLADSALAFAANGHGIQSMSIETSISHTKKVVKGDVLTAKAIEKNLTSKIGVYEVIVENQNKETVALFKGTVYRTGKEWEVD